MSARNGVASAAAQGTHSSPEASPGTPAGESQSGPQGPAPAGASEPAAAEPALGPPAATTSPTPFSGPAASVGLPGAALQQQIDDLRATVALALRRGSAEARLTLSPPELGSLRVSLTQTSGGLIARVSADSAAGAQALIAGQGDLRASLGSLGIALLHLDIGARHQQQSAGGRHPRARGSAVRVSPLAAIDAVAEARPPQPATAGAWAPQTIDIVV